MLRQSVLVVARLAKRITIYASLLLAMLIAGFVVTSATRSSVPLTRSALAIVNCADPQQYLIFCCPKPCPVFDTAKLNDLMQQQAMQVLINQLTDQLSGTNSVILSAIGSGIQRIANPVIIGMAANTLGQSRSVLAMPSGQQNASYQAAMSASSFSWDQVTRPSAARTASFANSPFTELSGRVFEPVPSGTASGDQDEANRRHAYIRERMLEMHAVAIAALAAGNDEQTMIGQLAPLHSDVGQFFRDDLAQQLPIDALRVKLLKDWEFLRALHSEAQTYMGMRAGGGL